MCLWPCCTLPMTSDGLCSCCYKHQRWDRRILPTISSLLAKRVPHVWNKVLPNPHAKISESNYIWMSQAFRSVCSILTNNSPLKQHFSTKLYPADQMKYLCLSLLEQQKSWGGLAIEKHCSRLSQVTVFHITCFLRTFRGRCWGLLCVKHVLCPWTTEVSLLQYLTSLHFMTSSLFKKTFTGLIVCPIRSPLWARQSIWYLL